MDSPTLMPIITVIVFIGVFIYAITIGMKNNAAYKQRVERDHRIRETLMSIDYTCDGRSLRIPRPPQWDDNEQVWLGFYPEMRQVFHITAPGHKPTTHHNDIGRNLWFARDIKLPQGFDTPLSITPRPHGPLTTEDVRKEIVPYLAAELNLNQRDIDNTTVELKGHEIRYTIEYRCSTIEHTPWVSYRPNATA